MKVKFHYDAIHKSFEGWYNLVYSDTDYLVYNIQHDNIYQWITEIKTHFDLSDSVREKLKEHENYNVFGKFKVETNKLPITEFVALNPKCYSFKHLKKDNTVNNTKTSKGVKICSKELDKA